jgi:hypothetical protein
LLLTNRLFLLLKACRLYMMAVAERLQALQMVPTGRFPMGAVPQRNDVVHLKPFATAAPNAAVVIAPFSGVPGICPKVVPQPD